MLAPNDANNNEESEWLDLWRRYSESRSGSFHLHSIPGFGKGAMMKIAIPTSGFSIFFAAGAVDVETEYRFDTSVWIPFEPVEPFTFSLRAASSTQKKAMESRAAKTGDRVFDRKYVLESDSPEKLQQLLSEENVREKIQGLSFREIRVAKESASFVSPGAAKGAMICIDFDELLGTREALDHARELVVLLANRLTTLGLAVKPATKPKK